MEQNLTDDPSGIVERAVEGWAASLVDLSGRNPLLRLPDARGVLDLAAAVPSEVTRLIEGDSVSLLDLFDDATPPQIALVMRLRDRAADCLQERGVRSSCIGLGLATWSDGAASPLQAVVLLAPVAIEVAPGEGRPTIQLTRCGEWGLNPALSARIRRDFGAQISIPENLDRDGDGIDFEDVAVALDSVRSTGPRVDNWSVDDAVILGNLAYTRQPIVDDLTSNMHQLGDHDVVRALAGDSVAQETLLESHASPCPRTLDDTKLQDEYLVLDADSSQSDAINAILAGSHLVIEGPPGTGKSQTIANLFATLVAHGKSVLFVAQKRAAIDAVVKRLKAVELDDLVLDLHDGPKMRRRVSEAIRVALDNDRSDPDLAAPNDDTTLTGFRDRLRKHCEAVNCNRDRWNASVAQLQSDVLRKPNLPHPHPRITPETVVRIDRDGALELGDAVAEWTSLIDSGMKDPNRNPWLRFFGSDLGNSPPQELLTLLTTANGELARDVKTDMLDFIDGLGLGEPASVDSWADLFAAVQDQNELAQDLDADCYDLDLDGLLDALQPERVDLGGAIVRRPKPGAQLAIRQVSDLTPRDVSDPDELATLLRRAISVRDRWRRIYPEGINPRGSDSVETASQTYKRLKDAISAAEEWVDPAVFRAVSVSKLMEMIDLLARGSEFVLRASRLSELDGIIHQNGLEPIAKMVGDEQLTPQQASDLTIETWALSALDVESTEDHWIGSILAEDQDRRVLDYQALDRTHIRSGSARVRSKWLKNQRSVRASNAQQARTVLEESRKARQHRSVQSLLRDAPDVITSLVPCWAMSPLTVCQALPSIAGLFDVVVFDEASQVKPAEAIPSILRAKQVVVAGDSHQLPPTSFFEFGSSESTDAAGDVDVTTGMESILDAMAALLPAPDGTRLLDWHYRSQDERLVAFSNHQQSLYRGTMTTFPGTISDAVQHILVDSGQSGGDFTTSEVEAVVDLMADHANTRPDESLGVIAFGIEHADALTQAFEQRCTTDKALATFAISHAHEPLFIKNLERVQGDERAAIILAIGYGPGPDGRLRHQFGPINQEGGERRLNVAITRARRRMMTVATFKSSDLEDARLNSSGAKMLKRYLRYAESRGEDLLPAASSRGTTVAGDSLLEDVAKQLGTYGVQTRLRLGTSARPISLAVAHTDRPSKFILAVETDGPDYWATPTVRDRDRLRIEQLGRLGWGYHRVWRSTWLSDPGTECERILKSLQETHDRQSEYDGSTERRTRSQGIAPAGGASTFTPQPLSPGD